MGSIIAVGICLALIGAILWFARKGGADAAQADATKEALKDVADANRPVDLPERTGVQQRYRRD